MLSLGVPAELWLKFLGFEVAGLTVPVRALLEICVVGHVCANQDLVTLAPQSEYDAEAIRHLLCTGCLSLTGAGHV